MDILNRKLYEWEKKISSLYLTEFIEAASLPKDSFSVQYSKGTLQIRYSHLPSALFAAKKTFESFSLGLPFPKGEYKAKNTWRVIDPTCLIDELFLLKLIEEGFNAIILNPDQEDVAVLAKEMGVKVLLRVEFPKDYCKILPFDESYPEMLQQFISNLRFSYDALYWQSPYFEHAFKGYLLEKFKLKAELHLEEIKRLENLATVFYMLRDTKHISALEQHAGPHIYIGLPTIDGMDACVPLIYCENNRRTFQKLTHGAIISVEEPWEEGSYYSCHMIAAASALWGLSSFEESGLNWFKLYRRELKIDEERHLLTTIARFSSKYSYFEDIKNGRLKKPSDEIKMQVEGLAAEKKLLEYHLQQAQKNQDEGYFFSEIETYLEELTTLSQEVLQRAR
jgi:hypothetical protein